MRNSNEPLESATEADAGDGEPLRTDPIPVERDDSPAERLEASTAPRPIIGYAPLNSALAANPMGMTGTGEPMLGGAFVGGAPTLLGLDVAENAQGDDGRVAQAAEDALAEDPRLATNAATGIQISVAYGVVELDGAVPTQADREIAEEVIAHLPGVAAVRNRLRVGD